ncbi:1-acyl-sn-glycerol-3-phosphate acyltransferase [Mesorhizobium sp. J428]|uniref:1-acyl-sn-glycerol-3-phosphate acyltransferase n=1 Tax=Mesorhizobium sp. J428 TaxID=2898440 RepID=UPI00215103FF|nr:1-acyl-sn-glycerol-3-phosphate acyltransferase [Mesorhizobium sp. J428]MCR5856933.1 1-acyl-sn-glycerol-3-phosphate acyltransferase [Mesorhizobium sp. J428]
MTTSQFGLLSGRLETLRTGGDHIVDQLIAERTQLISKHPLWPLIRPVLVRFLHYRQAVEMADEIARLDGWRAFEMISGLLSLDLTLTGLSNLPKTGGFILAPNHPTGIADGIAIFDTLKAVRPDMTFFANRDALRVSAGFRDMIIPVEWRAGAKSYGKSRDTLEMTAKAFTDNRPVVLFPSGRLAFWNEGKLTERPWQNSVVSLARRYNYPVVPAHISARNSGLFYFLSKHSTEIRDMTLFHELLNKKRQKFAISIGHPIAPDCLEGEPAEVAAALQEHTVVRMADDPDAVFRPVAPRLPSAA